MRTLALALTSLLAFTIPAAAQAQRASQRFYAKAGAFFPSVDSNLRIDGNGGQIGSDIDLESDLGLPKHKALPFGLVGWKFSENWRAEFEYFSLSRQTTHIIDKNLTIGNTTFPVNGSITSGLSTDVYRLAIGRSFARGDNYEVGGNIGIHFSNFGVFAEGVGTIAGTSGTLRSERREQLVPLPTLGLYGNFDINDTFKLVSRVNYFQLKISDYKGSLLDASVGINAMINRNFGIGADFRYVDYRLRATANDFTGRVEYNFYGPFVYAVVGF